jgi:hypothetical protein
VAAVGLPVCRRAKLLLAAVGYSSSLCYVAAVGLPVSRRAKNFVGRCGLFFRLLVSRCGLRGRCGPASLAAGLKTLLAAVGYSFVFCLAAVGYVAAVGLPVLRRANILVGCFIRIAMIMLATVGYSLRLCGFPRK